jgi:hypothetical protein
MSLLALIRLAFTRRKQRLNLLDGVFERAQATKSAAKMGYGNGLYSGDGAVGDHSIGSELNLHDAVPMAQGSHPIEINERRSGASLNGNFERLLHGARCGTVCHDGSYRLWEWDDTTSSFQPMEQSSS